MTTWHGVLSPKMPFRWVESPEEQSESHLALGLSPGTAGWLISNATLQSAELPLIAQFAVGATSQPGGPPEQPGVPFTAT